MTDLTLYNPFQQLSFIHNNCFLCGQPVSAGDVIPIFPEWLMTTYQLANQEILLLDKSILTYAELTVPCCSNCHQNHLEPLEHQVQVAADEGLTGWQQLDAKTTFQWLGKIFY